MNSVKQCNIKNNKLNPCVYMEEEFRLSTSHKALFKHIIITSRNGRQIEAILLNNSMVINFCPFCGGRIFNPDGHVLGDLGIRAID